MVLMLLVFEATVYRHQTHHYRQIQRSPPAVPTLFPGATRDTLDQGLVCCFKYLLNYTFYKFGLEVDPPSAAQPPLVKRAFRPSKTDPPLRRSAS